MPKHYGYYLVEQATKKIITRSYDPKIILAAAVRGAGVEKDSFISYKPTPKPKGITLEDFGFNHPTGVEIRGFIVGHFLVETKKHKLSLWVVQVEEGSSHHESI